MKNPFNPLFWIFLVAILIALRNIIDEMILVGVVAAISNIIGSFVYKWGQLVEARSDNVAPHTEE